MDAKEIRDMEHRFTMLEAGQQVTNNKLDQLPDDILAKILPVVMTKADCESKHKGEPWPWGKIISGVLTLAAIIAWGVLGLPGVPPILGAPGQPTVSQPK